MSTDSATLLKVSSQSASTSDQQNSRIWHDSAPKAILAAFDLQQEDEGWAAWVAHLASRKRPTLPKQLAAGSKSNPLRWSVADAVDQDKFDAILSAARVDSSTSKKRHEKHRVATLESWLNEANAAAREQLGLEALAWAYQMPALAQSLPASLWWQLLDRLTELASDATAIDVDQEPLAHQLLAGELPLVLSYLLPEVRKCRALSKSSKKALTLGLVESCDGQGLVHASNLPVFRPLVACWTRSAAIGKHVKGGAWKADAEIQYGWAIRQVLRLTRADGSQIFDHNQATGNGRQLMLTTLEAAGDRDDRAIAAENLPGKWTKDLNKSKSIAQLEGAALNSSWADISILRSDWTRKSPSLAASYPATTFAAELSNQSKVLSSGLWQTNVSHRGNELAIETAWEELCWTSDEDVDYLELQATLTGGVTMQRQLLLARQDKFLFVADALLAEKAGPWEYRLSLPLADGVVYAGEEETREGYLKHHHRKRALVLPPALPEWRVDRRGGSLGLNAAGLESHVSAEGSAMYAPLVMDLDPNRITKDRTWRQLTVAENLTVQPPSVAVGYRIQFGSKQWLIYRSLARPRNRTVLSHNLTSEFLVARFRRDGEFETMLEIEP
ncbi:MAG: hypothetical protein MI757_04160 [Pirellulales bacterium]|nr:hypothetical protein [Pirellulales bacterium]